MKKSEKYTENEDGSIEQVLEHFFVQEELVDQVLAHFDAKKAEQGQQKQLLQFQSNILSEYSTTATNNELFARYTDNYLVDLLHEVGTPSGSQENLEEQRGLQEKLGLMNDVAVNIKERELKLSQQLGYLFNQVISNLEQHKMLSSLDRVSYLSRLQALLTPKQTSQ